MAGTYKLISSTTLTGTQSTVVFSSIPATYTDLVIKMSTRSNKTSWLEEVYLRFNSDSTTKYSYTALGQGGGSPFSSVVSNDTSATGSLTVAASSTSNTFALTEVYIPSYTASQNKPFSIIDAPEMNDASTYFQMESVASLYRSTTAISNILIGLVNGNSFVSGSSFYLYGIETQAQQITAKATGGYITYDSNYIYHTFRESGTFTPTQSLTTEALIVAGGGAGGFTYRESNNWNWAGGGGGAGGLKYISSKAVTSSTAYTVTVGAGGSAGSNFSNSGSSSAFDTDTTVGGGRGGNYANNNGASGGSGGGACSYNVNPGTNLNATGGSGTSGQGNSGANSSATRGAGGGGAGAAATTANGGDGSNTYSTWAYATGTGDRGYYAGGGSAEIDTSTVGTAGLGGGGTAAMFNVGLTSIPGLANTGGGGGGAAIAGNTGYVAGAAGGSGIVIVRYAR